MKKITFVLLSLFLYSIPVLADCTTAYSAASYALAHTKRSLKADNFDHQKYYADRALEAFAKTRDLVTACGCSEAQLPITDASDNLELAVDPADWEEGRYYVKRALEQAEILMSTLDVCNTQGVGVAVNYDTGDVASLESNIAQGESDLVEKQRKLEEERQKLLAQQQELEAKIARQRQLADQARIQRQLELEEQLKLKRIAENSLLELRANLRQLAESLQCSEALQALEVASNRPDEVLQEEGLQDTRLYYIRQTAQLQQKVGEALSRCGATAQ